MDRPLGWIGIGPLPAGSRPPACRAARASIGGPGVLPSLCFGAALPRDAGAAIQNTRLPRRGHEAQGDNLVMGALARSMKGMGRWRVREALPCPTDAPGPAGALAQSGTGVAECSGNPYGPGGAGPRGERGHRGCITRAIVPPAVVPPCVCPPLVVSCLRGGSGKGGVQRGKNDGGGTLLSAAPATLFIVRMAGQLSMGLDRCRQWSGRNFEAGPLAVTGVACAARHFHSRRPSSPAVAGRVY